MTEINFYVSKEEGLEHRLAILHKLVLMAQKRNLNIHIHTDTNSVNQTIDDYLWTKDVSSFIPHDILSTEDTIDVRKNNQINTHAKEVQGHLNSKQINISHDYEPITDCDYLINFTNNRPSFFSRFSKVAEILDNSEEIITAGRKRYSFYRDRGYTLGYYQL